MVDVGGQRSYRSKWMQVFEGIDAVLFMISCGSFDQTLREDCSQNRLAEALELFRGVWQNRFLAETGLIVFLNKQDILEQKILAGKSIGKYFPEYKDYVAEEAVDDAGMCNEFARTRCFIKSKLVVRSIFFLFNLIFTKIFFLTRISLTNPSEEHPT